MRRTVDPATGVQVLACDNWDEFIAAMRSGGGGCGVDGLYRGQAARGWALASDFERRLAEVRTPPDGQELMALCSRHLAAFQELAAGLLGNEARAFSDDDWWALGRHHGLSTPLLDWSRSPYVASFFAFSEYQRLRDSGIDAGDAVTIWALNDVQDLLRAGEFELVAPRSFSNPRQRAQRGVFTRLTHRQHFDVANYLASRGRAASLKRWEIPASQVMLAIDDVEMANITHSTLFPELTGAAAEANMVYERLFAQASEDDGALQPDG